jgi:transcriptional regulator with XRE-family HTH domain
MLDRKKIRQYNTNKATKNGAIMSKSSLAIAALPAEAVTAIARLGKRLQLARKRRDWTVEELASMARISGQTVAKIERGEPAVALRMLVAIMAAMEISMDFEGIVREEENGNSKDMRRHLESLMAIRRFEECSQILIQRLGTRIRALRKAKSLNIDNLASCMYASPVTVRQLEKGSPSVSLGIAVAALTCLRRAEDINVLAAPENDKIGMSLDALRQSRRKIVRRKLLR